MSRITVDLPEGLQLDNEQFSDGWQLNNITGWWDTTTPRLEDEPREHGHGDHDQDEVFLSARYFTVTGVFQSYADPDALATARAALDVMHGRPGFEVTVTDEAGPLRSTAKLASRIGWDRNRAPGCAYFEFTLKADDPRRYGPLQVLSAGAPTPGVGIADPVLDPVQEGDAGNLGRVELVNTGSAPSEPLVRVAGGSEEGFELRCIETAQIVRVIRPVPDGSVIEVRMIDGTVWIDGESPLAATYVPVAEWISVGPGETCTLQYTPLGTLSGSPHMDVFWAVARW